MPQLITHNIFATEVYENLNQDIQKSICNSLPIYKMYAQSFDTFIYYFSLNFKKVKLMTNLRKKGHKTKVNKYFINMINNIKTLNLEKNEEALAYLFGSITHYVLDSTCHPFIFYKTGVYSKNNKKDTNKYKGLHMNMETNIDAFFYINKFKKSFHKVNTTKDFIPKIKFSKNLELIMNKTIKDTFNIDNSAKYYFKGYNNSRWLYPLIINDKHGIKIKIYKVLDKLLFFTNYKFEYFSTYIKQPKIYYLNIEHKKWVFPSNEKIKSNESFIDLYNKAIKKAIILITGAYNVLNGTVKIEEFEKKIENLSYVRGLDCDNSTYMKYFEF
ncbi:MAG: hypothetical protein E7158_01770 [Firmicutes bacterium]|nr:hypothetical protein [Bacillota bacterium]